MEVAGEVTRQEAVLSRAVGLLNRGREILPKRESLASSACVAAQGFTDRT